jgi:amino acid transporter
MTPVAPSKRPIPVVLLQVALVLAMLSVLPFGYYIYEHFTDNDVASFVLSRIPFLVVLAFMVFLTWALWYRKPYARWLGLPCIALLFAGLVYGYFSGPQVHSDGVVDPQDGFPWKRLIALALLAWWFHAFGFSRKSRVFFAVAEKPKEEQA